MSPALLLVSIFGVILLIALVWTLRAPGRLVAPRIDFAAEGEAGRRHVTYFPQVRQAMASEDFVFLASRGSKALARRVRKERRVVALIYLSSLRQDFLGLWRLARVIASMSPEIAARQELMRFRLGVSFSLRYEMLRLKFLFGLAPIPELGSLNEVVSKLAMRLETAMQELGEQAALATKLASSFDRRGLHTS